MWFRCQAAVGVPNSSFLYRCADERSLAQLRHHYFRRHSVTAIYLDGNRLIVFPGLLLGFINEAVELKSIPDHVSVFNLPGFRELVKLSKSLWCKRISATL